MAAGVEFQVGTGNTEGDRVALSLEETNASTMGLNDAGVDDISSQDKAMAVLDAIDNQALQQPSSQRGSGDGGYGHGDGESVETRDIAGKVTLDRWLGNTRLRPLT